MDPTAEIVGRYGFRPPFFGDPVDARLWRCTLVDYVECPIAPPLKDEILLRLSRYARVPLALATHPCFLASSLPPEQAVALLAGGRASERVERLVAVFTEAATDPIQTFQDDGAPYAEIVGLLTYVRRCADWAASHPGIVANAPSLVRAALGDRYADLPPATRDLFERFDEHKLPKSDGRIAVRPHEMSLSLLQAALESTADGLLIVDEHGRISQFNRRFLELWRMPREIAERGHDDEAIMHVLSQLVDPDKFIAKVRALYATPTLESFDVLKFRDGRVFERYSRPQLVKGRSVGRVWSFRDVTARVRAEETRFRAVTDSARDGVVTANRKGDIIEWNQGAQKAFGYEESEVVGRSLAILMPERFRGAHTRALAAVGNGGTSKFHGETLALTALRKDGREFPCEISINTWRAGDELFFTAFIRDITERKELQAKLLLADRMASVGTLAAGVAHEINNPLAFVATNLDTLDLELEDLASVIPPERYEELREILHSAQRGAERVRKIVRDLKTFSRSDEENAVTLDIKNVLDLSINISFNEIRHRAKLVCDFADGVPAVVADESRLGQVFINLLVNAAQAMDDGRADENEIRVTTRAEDERVIVEIADTGCGMSREVLDHIFDPFFTTKAVGQGTGLGLSICHGIVSKLGGELQAASTPGRGSTFRVVLPAARAEAA